MQTVRELHALIKRTIHSIGGLRELYTYDMALRIGAFLGLAPEFVYLHRGTRAGARALGLNAKLPGVAALVRTDLSRG
jgi:hypothetical protein